MVDYLSNYMAATYKSYGNHGIKVGASSSLSFNAFFMQIICLRSAKRRHQETRLIKFKSKAKQI